MRKLFPLIVLLIANSSFAEEVVEIRVLNSEFEVVNSITDTLKIAKFYNEWQLLELIDAPPNYEWTHKIDISDGKLSGRWLYNQAGYISRLNKRLKPSYKINNAAAFKSVLGL